MGNEYGEMYEMPWDKVKKFMSGRSPFFYRVGVPLAALLILAVGAAGFIWFGCRIEVGPGELCPLIRKTGKDLTNDMVLAPTMEFKGPQYEILKEGRHFRNPYTWWWPQRPLKATMIPNGRVGVLVRRYGKPLAPGEVIAAKSDQKGIVREPFKPGRHYINTWAYEIELVDMVKIEPGFMGVVTLRVGEESQNSGAFVVERNKRGVQPDLLRPGTHPEFSNPYVYLVTPIDVRSHKLEMGDQHKMRFPSKYGFDIEVEGIIEWAPDLKKLPELFVKFVDKQDLEASGGINNIEQKVILPFARSFFRTVGGSYRAVDYITGSTRIVVQNEVEGRLREACATEGIVIKSVVIKATKPPDRIRKQYERRENARRLKDRYEKEIEMEIGTVIVVGQKPKLDADGKTVLDREGKPVMAGGKPKLTADGKAVRQGGRLEQVIFQRKKDRESQFGLVREDIAGKIREAEQYRAVETTKAEKDLEVARINLEAAKDKAAAVLATGTAEAAVKVMEYKAEAEGVKAKVTAFVSGDKYAEYTLIMKLAPGITEILSNTEGLFATLFERFITIEKVKKAGTGN
jgi:regulator of protease activity HflC (stomatin/prohibitin superfamily)